MSLADEIMRLTAPPADVQQIERDMPQSAPKGWEPRADWDDSEATIVSAAWDAESGVEPAEAELLAERGLDPDTWEVVTVRYGEWQQSKRLENGDRDTITLRSKRVVYGKRAPGAHTINTDALVRQLAGLRVHAYAAPTVEVPACAFVDAGGDYQLGKLDGDGVEGTVDRFMAALGRSTARLERVGNERPVEVVQLPQLGDCIEGYVSQGGSKQANTGLALVEQIDLLIHLLTEQVRAYAAYGIPVVVPVIPGNHDEARRSPVVGLEHDSYAVLAAKQLRRALDMGGDTYEHVSIVAPPRGELTLTLDMAGVNVAMAHGHQFRPGRAHDWWDGQHHGMQLVGDARILLTAHTHHLTLDQSGIKTHMQVPALEGESRWWRHRKGQQSPPGKVSMLVGDKCGRPLTLPDGHVVHTGWEALEVA